MRIQQQIEDLQSENSTLKSKISKLEKQVHSLDVRVGNTDVARTLDSDAERITELEDQMQVFIEEQEKAKSATVDLLKLIFKDNPVVQDAIKPLSEESQEKRFGSSVRPDREDEDIE